MLKGNQDQRTRLLLQAVLLIGGEQVLADWLEVDQSTVNKWINNPHRDIPYDKALLIEEYTGIPVELLCSKSKKTNRYLRENYVLTKLVLRPIMKKQIVIPENFSEFYFTPNRPMIIGNDGMLISGLENFKVQLPSRTGHLRAAILDLEALWEERVSLKYIELLPMESLAIASRIDQLLGNHQGQRNDLQRPHSTPQHRSPKGNFELCLSYDEVGERKDEKIARPSQRA